MCLSEAVKKLPSDRGRPADVEFRFQVIESGGLSILEIVPVYSHGRFELSHADHLQARGQAGALDQATECLDQS